MLCSGFESNQYLHMSHFSYSCKIEWENGISCLISALCVNCKFTSEHSSGIVQKYSRNANYSTIWLCIWYGLLQKLEKDKIHLNSQVPLNYLSIHLLNASEIFQNVDYSRIWMSIWNGLLPKLEFKSKTWTFHLEFNGQVLVRQG